MTPPDDEARVAAGRKRWRQPTAKRGELKAQYGKERYSAAPELLYVWGGAGAQSPDARVLSTALEGAVVFDGKPLCEVLRDRGYDITTLRFSIQHLATNPTTKGDETP